MECFMSVEVYKQQTQEQHEKNHFDRTRLVVASQRRLKARKEQN